MTTPKKRSRLKIVFAVFGGILLLFVAALVLIPRLYKDQIHAKIKSVINEQINAKVDYSDFDLSLLRNFPYLTFSLEGFRLTGVDVFEKDTLAQIRRFDFAVNLMNVIRKEKIDIRKIALDSPKIYAHVLADGRANWDIAKPDTAPEVEDTVQKEPADFSLKLSKIEIKNGDVVYHDQAGKMHAEVRGLNFSGGGDLSADQYDFSTRTRIAAIRFDMDGARYVRDLKFESDIDLFVDSKNSKYTFKDNRVKLNELELQFDGFVQTPDSTVAMDVKFKALETRFKGILSLVPGMYTKDFASLKTDGSLALDGFVKGVYADNVYPAFNVNLAVANAFVQYPDLPAPIQNIHIDVNAANSTSVLDNTVVKVKKFHLEIEDNPVDLTATIAGLDKPDLDAAVKARVDLGKIMRVIPLEGLTLKGLLDLNATAKGKIDENALPALDASVRLTQGYVKSADFPAAIENLRIVAAAKNPTGAPADMDLDVADFHAEIDKEPIDAKLKLVNLDDPDYKLTLKGRLDLEKILKIYPVEGVKMKGVMVADLQTEGRMSAVEKQKFESLPTSGKMNLKGFEYASADVAQAVKIENADLSFTPHHIRLSDFRSTLGNSDVALDGEVQNYIGYLFSDKTIQGVLNVRSQKLDVNQWLSDEPAPAEPAPEDNPPLQAPEIPKNIDFTLHAAVGKVLYDNLTLENLRGKVLVRNQILDLSDLRFRLLGASFSTTGKYIAQDLKRPLYEFAFKIDSLPFQEAYKSFATVKSLAPIAKDMTGLFSTALAITGALTPAMDPVMESINANGTAAVINAKLAGFPALEKISELTKLDRFKEVNIKDTKLKYSIRDGRLFVEPFDVKTGEYVMNLAGSTGLDQTLDYKIKLDVPPGAAGAAATAALSNLVGRTIDKPERIVIDMIMGGTVQKPTLRATGTNVKDAVKDALKEELDKKKEQAKEELEKKKREAEEKARQEAEKARQEAERRAKEAADKAKAEAEKAKAEAERKKREAEEKARQEAERKKREAEEKAKKEAEEKLKDKLKFPR
jgi:uncharacterized protein involved in outer membrane biogenesis